MTPIKIVKMVQMRSDVVRNAKKYKVWLFSSLIFVSFAHIKLSSEYGLMVHENGHMISKS